MSKEFTDLEAWALRPQETVVRAVESGAVSVGEMILWMQLRSLTKMISALNRNLYEIGRLLEPNRQGYGQGPTEQSGGRADA